MAIHIFLARLLFVCPDLRSVVSEVSIIVGAIPITSTNHIVVLAIRLRSGYAWSRFASLYGRDRSP